MNDANRNSNGSKRNTGSDKEVVVYRNAEQYSNSMRKKITQKATFNIKQTKCSDLCSCIFGFMVLFLRARLSESF